MPTIKNIKEITVTTGTNGYIIDDDRSEEYHITGTETLLSNWEVVLRNSTGVAAGTPVEGMFVKFLYEAVVTLGGNHIYIFGNQMPDTYAQMEVTIEAYYDGSNWIVKYFVDDEEDSVITTDNIEDEAITTAKMADLAYGSVYAGNSSARPTAIPNSTGKDCLLVSNTGGATEWKDFGTTSDVTFSISSNKFSIGANKVTSTHIATSAVGNGLTGGGGSAITIEPDTTNGTSIEESSDGVRLDGDDTSPGNSKYYGTDSIGTKGFHTLPNESLIATLTLGTTDIAALNTTPQTVVGAISGSYILVEDFWVVPSGYGNAWTGNTTLELISNGASVAQYEEERALLYSGGTSNMCIGKKVEATAASDTQGVLSASLLLQTNTGDPTEVPAGKTIIIYVKYRVI